MTCRLKVRDICHGDQVATRAVVMQHKTQRPVQFEITQATREAVQKWIKQAGLKAEDFVFPSRVHDSPHLGTRQYARILEGWVEELGLDPADYGTHSMRRTKATLIYRRTKNLRAVQLLLGHSKLDYSRVGLCPADDESAPLPRVGAIRTGHSDAPCWAIPPARRPSWSDPMRALLRSSAAPPVRWETILASLSRR